MEIVAPVRKIHINFTRLHFKVIFILEICFALTFTSISGFLILVRSEEIEFLTALGLIIISIIIFFDEFVRLAILFASFFVGTDRVGFSCVLLVSSFRFEDVTIIIIIFHAVTFFLWKTLTARDFLSGAFLLLGQVSGRFIGYFEDRAEMLSSELSVS